MLKVGKIEYINVLPVYFGFIDGVVDFKHRFVEAVPSVLNEMLREGQIDISPVSSYEYLKNSHLYLLLPNLSISSDGKVKSVLFFSKVPIHQLHRKDVWLTKSSMTSKELVKFLLKSRYGVEPNYKHYSMKNGELPKGATAVLAIGDDAFKLLGDKRFPFVYDLGEEWHGMFGLPFVFAVWAVRRDSALKKKAEVAEALEKFMLSKAYGLRHLEKICSVYSKKVGLTVKECLLYYEVLNYDLEEKHLKALEKFAQITGLSFKPEFFHRDFQV